MMLSAQSPAQLSARVAAFGGSMFAAALAEEQFLRLRLSISRRKCFCSAVADSDAGRNHDEDDDLEPAEDFILLLWFVDGACSTLLDVEIIPALLESLDAAADSSSSHSRHVAKKVKRNQQHQQRVEHGDPEDSSSCYSFPIRAHDPVVAHLMQVVDSINRQRHLSADSNATPQLPIVVDPVPASTLRHFLSRTETTPRKKQGLFTEQEQQGEKEEGEYSLSRRHEHPLLKNLLPHQAHAVRFAMERRAPIRCLLADFCGGGKSHEALGVLASLSSPSSSSSPTDFDSSSVFPLIIVCPALARRHWATHLETWLSVRPDRIEVVYDSTDAPADLVEDGGDSFAETQRRRIAATIVSFTMLCRLFESHFASRRYKSIIVDESHNIRPADIVSGVASQQATCCARLASSNNSDATLLLLSGTPFSSKPFDVFAQIDMVSSGLLGADGAEFASNYLVSTFAPFYAPAVCHRPEELRLLLSSCVVRTEKEFVLAAAAAESSLSPLLQLPRFSRVVWRVVVPSEEESDVDDDDDDDVDTSDENDDQSDDSSAARARAPAASPSFQRQYQLSGLRKVSAIVERFEEELVASLDRVVFFAHHHAVLDAAQELLQSKANQRKEGGIVYSIVRIDGSVPAADRHALMAAFNKGNVQVAADRKCVRVALVSITAAGVALSLASCSTCIYLELPPDAMWLRQTEHRLDRMDPERGGKSRENNGNDIIDQVDNDYDAGAASSERSAVCSILCIDSSSAFDARHLATLISSMHAVSRVLPSSFSSSCVAAATASASPLSSPSHSRGAAAAGVVVAQRGVKSRFFTPTPSAAPSPAKSLVAVTPNRAASTATPTHVLGLKMEQSLAFIVSSHTRRVHFFLLFDTDSSSRSCDSSNGSCHLSSCCSLMSVPLDVLLVADPISFLAQQQAINPSVAPFLHLFFDKLASLYPNDDADRHVQRRAEEAMSTAAAFVALYLRHVKNSARRLLGKPPSASSRRERLLLSLAELREVIYARSGAAAATSGLVDAAALSLTATQSIGPRRAIFERYLPRMLSNEEKKQWTCNANNDSDDCESRCHRVVAQIEFFSQSSFTSNGSSNTNQRQKRRLDLFVEVRSHHASAAAEEDDVSLFCSTCRSKLNSSASLPRSTIISRVVAAINQLRSQQQQFSDEGGDGDDAGPSLVVGATDASAAEWVPFCSGECRNNFLMTRAIVATNTTTTTPASKSQHLPQPKRAAAAGGIPASARLRAATLKLQHEDGGDGPAAVRCASCGIDTAHVLRQVVAAGPSTEERMAALREHYPLLFSLSNPHTVDALASRIVTAATPGSMWQADHEVPVSQGGGAALPEENMQLLCVACHSQKTRLEQQQQHKKRRRRQEGD